MDKVRCADCGYLAVRKRQDRQLVEAEQGLRTSWFTIDGSYPEGLYEWHPLCFVMAADLAAEEAVARETDPQKTLGGKCTEVVCCPRECRSFFRWRQGYSPKEHRDVQIAEELQRLQREQKESDRRWQEARDRDQRQWQEQQAKSAHRRGTWNVLIGAGIAAVVGLITKILIG